MLCDITYTWKLKKQNSWNQRYNSNMMRYWEPGALSLMIYITEFVQREGAVSLSVGGVGLMRWPGVLSMVLPTAGGSAQTKVSQ